MSLLLDALKKAAEQKAEKARAEEGQEASASNENELDSVAEDPVDVRAEQDRSSSLPENRPGMDDQTDVDLSDYTDRLARVQQNARAAAEASPNALARRN